MFHLEKSGHALAPYDDVVEAFNYLVMGKILDAWGAKVPKVVKDATTEVVAAPKK
jgi:hypothetical protein